MKPGHKGIKRLCYATYFSAKGLKAAWQHEEAFRIHSLLVPILVAMTFFLSVSKIEQILMVGSVCLVPIVELLNSAIEAVVDRVGSEWHELSGRAKDMGSAAVLLTMLLALFTWLMILI